MPRGIPDWAPFPCGKTPETVLPAIPHRLSFSHVSLFFLFSCKIVINKAPKVVNPAQNPPTMLSNRDIRFSISLFR
jgi:hypothetical protein